MNINLHNLTEYLKKGRGIHIKEKNKGSFTKYCKGKVTQECIDKAKRSGNKKLIKRAVFAENSRKWSKKHQAGGTVMDQYQNLLNSQNLNLQQYMQNEELKKQHKEQMHWLQVKLAQSLGTNIGKFIGSIGGGLSMLAKEDESDTVEQNMKDRIEKTNTSVLELSKQQLESWKMDDAKILESLKLPVINSDEILGNDFLEMLNILKTK